MIFLFIFFLEIVFLFFISRRLHKDLTRFLLRVTGRKNWSIYILSVLFLPGTFVHEIAHFLSALFLLVPVGDVEFLPKIEQDAVKLGSVSIGKTDPVRRFLIGVSPLIVGIGVILTIVSFINLQFLTDKPLVIALLFYLIFTVTNTMFLSKKDLDGAWKFFLIVSFLFATIKFLGFEVTPDFFQSDQISYLAKTASIFLLVPLSTDLLAIFFLRVLND